MVVTASAPVAHGSTSTSTATFTVEKSDALYIHPSDNPGMMLVPVQFDGMGYRSWRRDYEPYP